VTVESSKIPEDRIDSTSNKTREGGSARRHDSLRWLPNNSRVRSAPQIGAWLSMDVLNEGDEDIRNCCTAVVFMAARDSILYGAVILV
jgi:hypothetical protein